MTTPKEEVTSDERAVQGPRYFVYDPEGGLDTYDTDEKRAKAHAEAIEPYLDDEWSEEVENVVSGVITHVTRKNTIAPNPGHTNCSCDECQAYSEAGGTDEWSEICDYHAVPVADLSAARAASTATAQDAEPFRVAVEEMVRMLEEGEWAEHVATFKAPGDELAARLEAAITDLHNDRAAAPQAGLSDETLRTLVLQIADMKPQYEENICAGMNLLRNAFASALAEQATAPMAGQAKSAVDDGCVRVPRKASSAMVEAGGQARVQDFKMNGTTLTKKDADRVALVIYSAMIDAAPSAGEKKS